MIEIYDSKDITLEICQEIKKLAKEAKACKASYVPFIKALRKKDLEECVAIINGEIHWLSVKEILPYKFVRNGRFVKYYGNGQKYIECNYVNDERQGKYVSWYVNGQKYEECNYVNGKHEGDYESWHLNGQKYIKCSYAKGKRNGRYVFYNSNGQILSDCIYTNGVLQDD